MQLVLVPQRTAGGFYRDQRIEKEVSSAPVTLEVQALPSISVPFEGAVGKFSISAQINQSSFTTDDLMQLTLSINGSGNLGLITAPTLQLPNGMNTIAPEVKDNFTEITPDFSGSRTFTYNISVDKPGLYTIPPIEFRFFDVVDHQYKTLRTQPMNVNIAQGMGNKDETIEGRSDIIKDIRDIVTTPPTFGSGFNFVMYKWYYWLAMLLSTIAFLTFTKRRQRKINAVDKYDEKAASRVAAQRLTNARNALQTKNSRLFFEEISKAVWLYLSDRLQLPLKQLNKESLRAALKEKAIPEATAAQTLNLIAQCEMALYTPLGGQQQKETLATAADLIEALEQQFNQKK
jgi:hypothetical protein